MISYNCVIRDTSPVYMGANAFIAPGVCLACSGHAMLPRQRAEGIGTSKRITIEDDEEQKCSFYLYFFVNILYE